PVTEETRDGAVGDRGAVQSSEVREMHTATTLLDAPRGPWILPPVGWNRKRLRSRLLRLRRNWVCWKRESGETRRVASLMPLGGDRDGDRIADTGLGSESGEEAGIGDGNHLLEEAAWLATADQTLPDQDAGGIARESPKQ